MTPIRVMPFRIAALSLLFFPLRAATEPLIGYGSSDAVLPAKTQELFYLGFELGISLALDRKDVSGVVAIEHAWEGSPLGAQKSAEKLVQRGVVAITGYPTSQDALLASKVSMKAGLIAIFAAARHSDVGKLGPMVVSTVPSMDFDIEQFFRFIRGRYPGKKGLLISNPYNIFSKNQEELFAKRLKDEKAQVVDVKILRLNKDLKLSEADLNLIKGGAFDYFFLTTYPDASVRVLGQLDVLGMDLPIIANASWTTDDFELIRRLLIRHKSPVYSVSLWIHGSDPSRRFEQEFRNRFGRDPSSEAAYGFDLGTVVGKTLSRITGNVTKESVIRAFYSNPCFAGLTSGEICFSRNGGHARREATIVRFSQGGFVPLDPEKLRRR